jgi:hypothetical protein
MIEPVADGRGRTATIQIDPGAAGRPRLRLVTTIVDCAGDELALALADDDAQLMGRAIGLLIAEQPARGSMVKLTTCERVFALSRTVNEAGDVVIRVCDVYNPREHVTLSLELAELVAALLAAGGQLRAQMPTEGDAEGAG